MTLPPRQHDILELARERGYVSIDELAQAFAVTPQTIRRDINQLAEQGLLRRTLGARDAGEPTVLGLADLQLDLIRRRATRAGQRLDLTAKEFGLLELLMRRQGEVLPRSLIASQVWDMNFDSDTNVIEVAMRRLRLKVDDGQLVKLIQTVRGMGYVLEAAQEP